MHKNFAVVIKHKFYLYVLLDLLLITIHKIHVILCPVGCKGKHTNDRRIFGSVMPDNFIVS